VGGRDAQRLQRYLVQVTYYASTGIEGYRGTAELLS
jgi:hypothetical protein